METIKLKSEDSIVVGVIGLNKVNMECIDYDFYNAIDLFYEENKIDHIKTCDDDDCIADDHDTYIQQDYVSGEVHLLNYIKDPITNIFVPDMSKDFSAIYDSNDNILQITYSKYVTYSACCSPCFPGQGDLYNEGNLLTYTLPPNYISDSKSFLYEWEGIC